MEQEIDALERAAGIQTAAQRAVFWRQFGHLSPPEMLDRGWEALLQMAPPNAILPPKALTCPSRLRQNSRARSG